MKESVHDERNSDDEEGKEKDVRDGSGEVHNLRIEHEHDKFKAKKRVVKSNIGWFSYFSCGTDGLPEAEIYDDPSQKKEPHQFRPDFAEISDARGHLKHIVTEMKIIILFNTVF